MPFQLRSGLSYCLCDGRPVFLDVAKDRYFMLPASLCQSFRSLVTQTETVPESDLESLLALRVLEPTSSGHPWPVPAVQTPTSEVMAAKTCRGAPMAFLAQGVAKLRLRYCSFQRVMSQEAARRPTIRVGNEERDMAGLRAAFDSIAIPLGDEDNCLARSLGFRMLAFRRGYRPNLVLGVKLDPFAAHCWVQTGSRVDNDSLERVRHFTPILAF